jgi:murein L,D-transpeptidase YafK
MTVGAAALTAGCEDQFSVVGPSSRAQTPIPDKTLAKMDALGTSANAPMLIRTYKQEAELEIWKQKSDGQYALLRTFPMCRWSGQLGPKVREGDMQVPEGFYTITPGQMNPNSNYYLSFNVGYPNAYDRALGHTGGNIMVHGICSSAGCFSMTDAQIAEIYALAREAFAGGQREIQMQSYPFRMTAENLAKHRLNPNIAFWKELKNGADHFEVTLAEPKVVVCGKHYVFGATAPHEVSATEACPKLQRDDDVEAAVAEKAAKDDVEVAALVAKGVKPIQVVYADGGQNTMFAGKIADASDPDALEAGPRIIPLDENGKPIAPAAPAAPAAPVAPAASAPSYSVASAASSRTAAEPSYSVASASSHTTPAPSASPKPTATPAPSPYGSIGFVGGLADGGKDMMASLIAKVTGNEAPAVPTYEPAEPIPTDVPLPPKRAVSTDAQLRLATSGVETQ